MSIVITPVYVANDTFDIWVGKVNSAIDIISANCVTCNSDANGGLTTGNGWVQGTFGASDLVANTIRWWNGSY